MKTVGRVLIVVLLVLALAGLLARFAWRGGVFNAMLVRLGVESAVPGQAFRAGGYVVRGLFGDGHHGIRERSFFGGPDRHRGPGIGLVAPLLPLRGVGSLAPLLVGIAIGALLTAAFRRRNPPQPPRAPPAPPAAGVPGPVV